MQPSAKVAQLLTDVEELLAELGDEHGPEVAALRGRIESAIETTRASLEDTGAGITATLRQYAVSLDDYIVGYPRLAFATGVLAAATLGYLIGTAVRSRN